MSKKSKDHEIREVQMDDFVVLVTMNITDPAGQYGLPFFTIISLCNEYHEDE